MRIKRIFLLSLTAFLCLTVQAQNNIPGVSPSAIYINDDGKETEATSDFAGQAPLAVTFHANPYNMSDYNPIYEWHFQKDGEEAEMMVRYEEDTEYTFTESGTFIVTLKAKTSAESEELPSTPIKVTVSESKLSFPNAFSPNGDDKNPTFKAKEYQSIVEFHAYIFNRWGQKLYEWTDPAGEWDGTYNGKVVRDGTYFLLVKAKGADGREYNIRKDVNVLTGFTEENRLNY